MWSASSRTVTDDVVERDVALAHEVLEPAGAGDEDVDAALQRLHLAALADAAEDWSMVAGPAASASGTSVSCTWVASSRVGQQDERARAAAGGAPTLGGEARDERQREGDGLAAAGAAAAEHVAARQRVGQRRGLDRERRRRCPASRGRRRGSAARRARRSRCWQPRARRSARRRALPCWAARCSGWCPSTPLVRRRGRSRRASSRVFVVMVMGPSGSWWSPARQRAARSRGARAQGMRRR